MLKRCSFTDEQRCEWSPQAHLLPSLVSLRASEITSDLGLLKTGTFHVHNPLYVAFKGCFFFFNLQHFLQGASILTPL